VFKTGDGSMGWPQHSPFDKIIVTAGAPLLPASLSDQLSIGGRMIIPTGNQHQQDLMVYDKTQTGLQQHIATQVVFVPLVGSQGWQGLPGSRSS
jgi:protein-L-isoaspartate(D-aspartate) O-methyltransferase